MIDDLNYHHLRYFWAVAKSGNLTATAKRMRVAQSALSAQIRQLEEQLGEALFERTKRKLVLTEAGRIAQNYAEDIFGAGRELVATLSSGRRHGHVLNLGAVATLSRNFQESFVQPLLKQEEVTLRLQSGTFDELLARLLIHELDVVLSNQPVQREAGRPFHCRRIARQLVSIVGRPRKSVFRFPQDLDGAFVILPSSDAAVRASFDALCEQYGVRVRVRAEVDDMAMMRLLARDTDSLALLPTVVVRDELQQGVLQELCPVAGLHEDFYAITVQREFQHPLLRVLLSRKQTDMLGG